MTDKNFKLIQTQFIRDCVEEFKISRGYQCYLPIVWNTHVIGEENVWHYSLPSGSILKLKFKGQSLFTQTWEEGRFFTERQRRILSTILIHDFGMKRGLVNVLIRRPKISIQRIEEFISGMIDSIWLANEMSFIIGSADFKLLKKLIKKIFGIGSTNLPQLVKYWKEWGNFRFHKFAHTITIGELEPISQGNPFKILDKLTFMQDIISFQQGLDNRVESGLDEIQAEKLHYYLQQLAYMTSSRQMPYMGDKTEDEALQQFKKVLKSTYRSSDEMNICMGQCARRIGGICRTLAHCPVDRHSSHFSLTSSGEFTHSLAKGAQAEAVREGIAKILCSVPEQDYDEETPFGIASHKKGLEDWRTLFRDKPILMDGDFMSTYDLGLRGMVEDTRYLGLDECLGLQIMYCAWKTISAVPEVRTEVVHEMGNKARHITVSEWPLNILEAPLAHIVIEALKWHPAAWSSFHRQDQCWEAVKQLTRIKDHSFKEKDGTFKRYMLSSDLKDATNAQQWELTKHMYYGFMEGYGLIDDKNRTYIDLVLSLIGPRLVHTRDDDLFISSTGIMMGEPLAKPGLCLLNLCIEEYSFLKYIGRLDLLKSDEPAPYRAWRFIHIGGDDHVALGPREYLDLITDTHIKCGSHVSPGQHGMSRIAVKYTERVINLYNIEEPSPMNRNTMKSIIVDTVKVRLLEKGQSTLLKKDNKNVAVGKCKQLASSLDWMPIDNRFYNYDEIISYRNLFIQRMGNLLPKADEHPRAYANIHLPMELGGYGLGLRREMPDFLARSPEPTKYLLAKIKMSDEMQFTMYTRADMRVFRKLNQNLAVRGIPTAIERQNQIIETFLLNPYGLKSWDEIKYFDPDPTRAIDIARAQGYVSIEKYAEMVTRPVIFEQLLVKPEDLKLNSFNTSVWIKTYHDQVWTWYERDGGANWDLSTVEHLSVNEFENLLKRMKSPYYININQSTTPKYIRDVHSDTMRTVSTNPGQTLIQRENTAQPSLLVDPKILGFNIYGHRCINSKY
jgi:hypothetical protein